MTRARYNVHSGNLLMMHFFLPFPFLLYLHISGLLVSATWLLSALKAQKHQPCLGHFLGLSAIVLLLFVLDSISIEVTEVYCHFSS